VAGAAQILRGKNVEGQVGEGGDGPSFRAATGERGMNRAVCKEKTEG
jgi:hypothetical protein